MVQNIFSIKGILIKKSETTFRGKYRERILSIGTKTGETFHITASFDWAEKAGEIKLKQEIEVKFTIQSRIWKDKNYNTLNISGIEILSQEEKTKKTVRTFTLKNFKKERK